MIILNKIRAAVLCVFALAVICPILVYTAYKYADKYEEGKP
jgi:hypothetical protein